MTTDYLDDSKMPRSVKYAGMGKESLARSYSSDEMEEVQPVNRGVSVQQLPPREGPKLWSVFLLSALASAAAVAAIGGVCALVYPILKELRVEKVIGHDGTEERMLGFWSILVLSVLAGLVCCASSWTLTYLDLYQPGTVFSTMTQAQPRDASGHGFHLGYGVTILNGVMGFLTVIWNLA